MPRPKGSKNRRTDVAAGGVFPQGALTSGEVIAKIEAINSSIAAAEDQIEELGIELREKKAELKALKKTRTEAEAYLAERKAQEDQMKILDAVASSGKSVDEILAMLRS